MYAIFFYTAVLAVIAYAFASMSPQSPDLTPVRYSPTFDKDPVPGGRSG